MTEPKAKSCCALVALVAALLAGCVSATNKAHVTDAGELPPGAGFADGKGSAARFNHPSGVAVDDAGNVYVADTEYHMIRKVSPAGVVTTIAGGAGNPGGADGPVDRARFRRPSGIAVDSAGNLYVADTLNGSIRKVNPAGLVTTLAGEESAFTLMKDGQGKDAVFGFPSGMAVDSAGNLYVADTYYYLMVRKVSPAGGVTTPVGGKYEYGSTPVCSRKPQIDGPYGVAVDGAGNLYAADKEFHIIRKVSPSGVVTTLAGSSGNKGSANGTGSAARFFEPRGLTMDNVGNLYVADSKNNTIRKVSPAGDVTTLAGCAGKQGSADGEGSTARFSNPQGLAVDKGGNVYVADSNNNAIRKVSPTGVVTTLAGCACVPPQTNVTALDLPPGDGYADGLGSAARFYRPSGLVVDGAGNVYVADTRNHTIRKVDRAGVVTTLAGSAGNLGIADGVGCEARFNNPNYLAVDRAGNIYVSENRGQRIRKITPAGSVTTLAGSNDKYGSADSPGSVAEFAGNAGLGVDRDGNVYVADEYYHTIRKVTPTGMVTTLAGTAGISGRNDGTTCEARFHWPTGMVVDRQARFRAPTGVAVDRHGNLYVADTSNHTIRMVSIAGVVTTFAGRAGVQGGADGTGMYAQLFFPRDVAVDRAGNLFVADGANTIRKVSPAGVVTTLAGHYGGFVSADGKGTEAGFSDISGIAVDNAGNVYVSDGLSNTIRKVTPEGVVTTFAGRARQ